MSKLPFLRKLPARCSSPRAKVELRAYILFVVIFVPCVAVFFVVAKWLFRQDQTYTFYVVIAAAVVANVVAYLLNSLYSSRRRRKVR